MHLARRSYVLELIGGVLAVLGIWSLERGVAHLWGIPLLLLLLGLVIEGALIRRLQPQVRLATAPRAYLGRPQAARFEFANGSARLLALEYAAVMPAGVGSEAGVRRISIAPRLGYQDEITLLPIKLGVERWPALPARRGGPL